MLAPPLKSLGGGGRLCGEKLAVIIHDKIISQRLNNGSLKPKTCVSLKQSVWSLK